MNEDQVNEDQDEVAIPVYREELSADVVPVVTGGVRVTKRTQTRDEVLEQQLRTSSVQVKRVQVNRPVDGPQKPRRDGKTLIVPVVSEVLQIQKQWVLTEEIHITETEETKTEQRTISLDEEQALVERVDAQGNVLLTVDNVEPERGQLLKEAGILKRPASGQKAGSKRKILSNEPNVLGH